MTTNEAAHLLGITTSTVSNQIEKGRIRASKAGRYWDISPAEVERYRRKHLGHRERTWTREAVEHRLIAISSPETRAKMRAAKLGRRQTPEHIANSAAARRGKPLSEAHRQSVSAALKGKPFTPTHLAAVRASATRPERNAKLSASLKLVPLNPERIAKMAASKRGQKHSEAHRHAISHGMVEAYLSGRRSYSRLEIVAADLLLPFGYVRFPWMDGHAFDFGTADGRTVVEVNGCRLHDHRLEKAACPFTPMYRDLNERYRVIAAARGIRLIELWECERADWPTLIA